MYLHLGNDIAVRTDEIVAIFDLENTSVAQSTKKYLAIAQKTGCVVNVSYEMPKSFIICDRDKKITVYISQISPQTLKKRIGKFN